MIKVVLAVAWLAVSGSLVPAHGATVQGGTARATVAEAARGPLQCVLDGLALRGYPVRFLGGWARGGHVRGSLHYAGMALDVNQTARGRTVPHMPRNEVAIAHGCGAVSGATWCRGDSGHFQVGGWEGCRRGSRRHSSHAHVRRHAQHHHRDHRRRHGRRR